MELVFGLQLEQLWERFYTRYVQGSESMARFVLRVEQLQMQLGIDAETTYHAFVHKLDMGAWVLLESVLLHKQAVGGGSIQWLDVVNLCRDLPLGVSLVAGPAAP